MVAIYLVTRFVKKDLRKQRSAKSGPEVIIFFRLNSAEHEILNAHMHKI